MRVFYLLVMKDCLVQCVCMCIQASHSCSCSCKYVGNNYYLMSLDSLHVSLPGIRFISLHFPPFPPMVSLLLTQIFRA